MFERLSPWKEYTEWKWVSRGTLSYIEGHSTRVGSWSSLLLAQRVSGLEYAPDCLPILAVGEIRTETHLREINLQSTIASFQSGFDGRIKCVIHDIPNINFAFFFFQSSPALRSPADSYLGLMDTLRMRVSR